MKTLHIVSGMNLNAGGPTQSIYNLVKGLLNKGVDAKILTLVAKYNYKLLTNQDFVIKVGKPIVNNFSYSSYFKKELKKYAYIDLIHAPWFMAVSLT